MRNVKKAISLVVACALLISVFASSGIPVFALSGTAEYSPVESNLSAKYWVTATASSNPVDASLAIDGDNQTVWMADTTDTQRYIEFDLGDAYDAVRKTEVVFAGNKAAYQYKIEGSKDKNGWYILADRTGNTRVAGGFTDVFNHEGTRYIRLTIMGGSPVGVREFNAINNVATGEITNVPVARDTIDPASYTEAGTFTVKGTAASTGNMNEVTADVTVLNSTSVSDDSIARIDFNDGWQFYLATRTPSVTGGTNNGANFAANGLADAGAYTADQIISPSFDDSSWRSLSVPHDWSIEGEKVSSDSSNAQAYLQGGLGWYRKTFILPEAMEGKKRIAVDFEGVYQNANVYVNGQLVGNYPNGYTGFTYDITDYVAFGDASPNVIVVKVQNMSSSGRWYTGSGITRPVTLVVTDQTRFVRNGVVITTPTLEQDYKLNGSSTVAINAKAYSDDSNGIVALKTTIYDAAGNVVLTKTSDYKDINPSTLCEISDELIVPNVHLWSIEDPYRYTVQTDLLYERNGGSDGAYTVDSTTSKFGFRYFRIDNDEGFFLNGKYTKFQGVDLHHDSGALGAAGTYDAFKRQMSILKSMGVNAYRTSHNPPSKAMIDVCSELGILVMEEAYDGWGSPKATYDFGNFFLKEIPFGWAGSLDTIPEHTLWSDWVIKEMVGRDINEPSVVMWSIGNEVRGVGTKPGWYNWTSYVKPDDPVPSNYSSSQFNEYTEALRLRNGIKSLDASRYIVMGGDQERSVPNDTSTWHYINQALDGYGLNYNTAESVDGLHTKYSDTTFFFESESSSQTGARGVYSDPSMPQTGVNQTPGKRGTSSYDNNFASWTIPNEYGLKKDRDREYFLGQFIWSGFDYLGEPTPYSVYPVGISSFGTIDTAGFFKDSYYLFKSQWNSKPMAHIVPMNWNDRRIGEEVEVWVNTNAVKAELFLNGVSLGVKSFDEKETNYGKTYYETTEATKDNRLNTSNVNKGGYISPNSSYGKLHLTWKVPYAPGELKAVAMNATSNAVATDIMKTAGQAYTINMKTDKSVVKADGRNLVYVECDVVDKDGVTLPSAGNLVKFDVEGGTIVGVDNGKQESTELYKWGNVEKNTHSERSAYNGKVLVIIQSEKGNTGEISLTASSENMVPSNIKVMATGDGIGDYMSACVPAELGTVISADTVSFALETGKAPVLPKDIKVNYASGNSLIRKVAWSNIKDSQFTTPGALEISGVVDGIAGLSARAMITVSAASEEEANIALNAEAGPQVTATTSGALATASFTNGTSYPNLMLDGNANSSWTNKYNAGQTVVLAAVNNSHPYEFVEVYWPMVKAMNAIDLHFITGGSNPSTNLPKSLNIQYWDGFAWIDATGQNVELAAVSNEATKITFDRVMTSRVRVGMENATPYSTAAGAMAISEFKVFDVKTDSAAVEAPTASVGSGIYSTAQSVILSSATEGADIYYTTDSTTPTAEAAIIYTGPITISTDTTLKAIAVKDGMTVSNVAEFNYVIVPDSQVVPPTASVGSGTYSAAQSVILSSATEGADIYYTTDGTTPTTGAAIIYAGPITISADTTLKAIAVKDGMTDSNVAEFNYVIAPDSQVVSPTASVGSGTYSAAQSVILSSATEGADIYYTTDGTTPTTGAAIIYTGPITISADTTLKAIAVKDSMTASIVAEFNYVIVPYSEVIPGDVNNNGSVDIGDLAAAAFNNSIGAGDSGWSVMKAADLNNDAIISIEDLILIARKILQE
ncbi:MAG: chitobiase/beta-hexosaminidase C-terminal domain-containing protein [Ruminiclostridium sp.]